MNIHPFSPSYNVQEAAKKSPKLSSPSYTKTSESLYNIFPNTDNTSMAPNRNHSREMIQNQSHQLNVHTSTKPQTKLPGSEVYVTINDIKWNNDQGFFTSDMELKVQYTVTRQLEQNISWQVIYLGSAYSQKNDQVLISFETEENEKGLSFPEKRQFKLSIQPPKWHLIQPQELFSTTAITISAFYKGQEFVKIGYYIHYQVPAFSPPEKSCISRLQMQENLEEKYDKRETICKKKKITKKFAKKSSSQSQCFNRETQGKILQGVLSRTVRTILGDKPRITRFPIDWQKQIEGSNGPKIQVEGESTEILQNQHLITQYMKPSQSLQNL